MCSNLTWQTLPKVPKQSQIILQMFTFFQMFGLGEPSSNFTMFHKRFHTLP